MKAVAALCMLIGTVTAASAQQTGSRLPGSSGRMLASSGDLSDDASARPDDEAMRVVRGMAKCIVLHKRADVERYLVSRDELTQKANYQRFAGLMPICMNAASIGATKLQMKAASLSGAFAEVLLADRAVPDLAAIEPSKTETPYWLSTAADQRVVQEMAICLTDRYPSPSAALLRSASGSPGEGVAFGALAPMMGPCLVEGATLRANRSGIRLALASAMYHRLIDPAEPASAGKR